MHHKFSFTILIVISLITFNAFAIESDYDTTSSWFFEIKGSKFIPNVDDEFGGSSTPFRDIFGNDGSILYKMRFDYELFKKFGIGTIGVGSGFYRVVGKALSEDGSKSEDDTALILMPNDISLTYRFDLPSVKWNIPLVPYIRGALTYTFWWITQGNGGIATWNSDGSGGKASGGTYGYEFSLGCMLLLDFFDPDAAVTMDREIGINNSYIFFEWTSNTSDNFGKTSLMVGGKYWAFGLAFEF